MYTGNASQSSYRKIYLLYCLFHFEYDNTLEFICYSFIEFTWNGMSLLFLGKCYFNQCDVLPFKAEKWLQMCLEFEKYQNSWSNLNVELVDKDAMQGRSLFVIHSWNERFICCQNPTLKRQWKTAGCLRKRHSFLRNAYSRQKFI